MLIQNFQQLLPFSIMATAAAANVTTTHDLISNARDAVTAAATSAKNAADVLKIAIENAATRKTAAQHNAAYAAVVLATTIQLGGAANAVEPARVNLLNAENTVQTVINEGAGTVNTLQYAHSAAIATHTAAKNALIGFLQMQQLFDNTQQQHTATLQLQQQQAQQQAAAQLLQINELLHQIQITHRESQRVAAAAVQQAQIDKVTAELAALQAQINGQ